MYSVFIALETFMLAANPSVDRQVACRLNQSMNHRLKSAFGPGGRRFLLPFSQPPEVSWPTTIATTQPSLWPYSFTALPSAQLEDKNDKFCPFPRLRWGSLGCCLVCIALKKTTISLFCIIQRGTSKNWNLFN